MARTTIIATSLAVLALAGCSTEPGNNQALDQLDRNLTGNAANDVDPALAAALEDQILVDPQLSGQSNRDAIRTAGGPMRAEVPSEGPGAVPSAAETGKLMRAPAPVAAAADTSTPATLGALAEQQAGGARDCVKRLNYSFGWAARMPAAMPLYPRARVTEAAGADSNGCTLRVIGFTTGAGVQDVIDYYYTQAQRGGFSAEHVREGSEQTLGGTRGGQAYAVFARPRAGGGSEVELIADGGQ